MTLVLCKTFKEIIGILQDNSAAARILQKQSCYFIKFASKDRNVLSQIGNDDKVLYVWKTHASLNLKHRHLFYDTTGRYDGIGRCML